MTESMLDCVLSSMEFYQKTYPEDAAIVVADTEKVVGYLPGEKIDLKIPLGATIEAFRGTVTEQALSKGSVMREERGSERFGFAYISSATPILDNGKVVGVLSAIVSNDRLEAMRTGASELAAMVEELTATADGVAQALNSVAESAEDLAAVSETVRNSVKNIDSMIAFVQEIASQSNLLGLNAAIEAARAGEQGRGFAVVADEIRKMADSSKTSAKDIAEHLKQITQSVVAMDDRIQRIHTDTEENAASVEELKATFDHIAATADALVNAAQ